MIEHREMNPGDLGSPVQEGFPRALFKNIFEKRFTFTPLSLWWVIGRILSILISPQGIFPFVQCKVLDFFLMAPISLTIAPFLAAPLNVLLFWPNGKFSKFFLSVPLCS
jgi:hypothetical protein